MGHSLWGHKELDMTEQLTRTEEGSSCFFHCEIYVVGDIPTSMLDSLKWATIYGLKKPHNIRGQQRFLAQKYCSDVDNQDRKR